MNNKEYIIIIALIAAALLAGCNSKTALEWYAQGQKLTMQGEFDEALKAYDEALKIDPQYKNAWFVKGDIYSWQKKYPEALKAYNEVLKIDPKYQKVQVRKARVLNGLGMYPEAIKTCDEALSLDPADAHAWYNRAAAYSGLQKKTEALRDLAKAIGSDAAYSRSSAKNDENFQWLWPDEDFQKLAGRSARLADDTASTKLAQKEEEIQPAVTPESIAFRQQQLANIQEAAFRYRIEHDSASDTGDVIYYLNIVPEKSAANGALPDNGDPSDEFMQRFKGSARTLKKASQSKKANINSDGDWEVRDKETNQEGAVLSILSVKWITDTKVTVTSDYSRGPLWGHGENIQLEFKDNKWVITGYGDIWFY